MNIVNSGSYINTLDTFVGQTVGNAVVYASTSEEYGTETLYVQGWSVSTARTISFQYNIDGGSWISLPGYYRNDVAAATPGYYADINAFDANINIAVLSKGTHKMLIRAHTSTGTYYQVAQITINIQ